MSGNLELIQFIRARIASDGPVPFRWFMEQALYHPQHGYYASDKAAIGRDGDFFTSVSVGALFGKLLATQFVEMWMHLGRPDPFTLVEQGANTGDFAVDVLSAIQASAPNCFAALRYRIVEPQERLQNRQESKLAAFPQVAWRRSLDELEPFTGVHFSNELIDSMPVNRVRFSGGAWHEQYVNADFQWIDRPLSSSELARQTAFLPILENYRTEINLESLAWIRAVASRLVRGYVLAMDYGYPRAVYYSPERTEGTLATYANHQRGDNPLETIGMADLTAHVDFTSLAEQAEQRGLELAGYTDQHHFMVGMGSRVFADVAGPVNPARQKEMRAFQTLMHPNFMGLAFKAIGFSKGVEPVPLLGFALAPEPRIGLGLEAVNHNRIDKR